MKTQEVPGRPARLFHLSTIIAVITNRNISYDLGDGRWGALRNLTTFMVGEGDPVMTEGVVRLVEECQPLLQQQHPDLPTECPISGDGVTHVDTDRWIAGVIRSLGEEHRLVTQIDPVDHTHIDPLTEVGMWWPEEKRLPPIVIPDDPETPPYTLPL